MATGAAAVSVGRVAQAADGQIDNVSRSSAISAYQSMLAPTLAVPVGWTGSLASCDAGTTSHAHRRATLAAVNNMRATADLGPVVLDAGFNARAQAALIMTANGFLDHEPPSRATCWTKDGFDGARDGNISLGFAFGDDPAPLADATGARSVVSYVTDAGDGNDVVGHRRCILYQQLTRIGTGDTDTSNTMYVIDKFRKPKGKTWVAWPTAEFFPRELEPAGRWSLSYPGANFAAAKVAVTTPNGPIAAHKAPTAVGFGDDAIAWDAAARVRGT